MAGKIIFEWGTCTSAVQRLRLVLVDAEILHHVLVVKNRRCGMIVNETATHQMPVEFKLLKGPIMAFNNEPESIPKKL